MTPRLVRRVVITVCVAGIAGMIVASVAGVEGAALTFGLVSAAAVACLMVATAVGGGSAASGPAAGVDEARAARVEELVGELVRAGAAEATVRELVAEASRLRRHAG